MYRSNLKGRKRPKSSPQLGFHRQSFEGLRIARRTWRSCLRTSRACERRGEGGLERFWGLTWSLRVDIRNRQLGCSNQAWGLWGVPSLPWAWTKPFGPGHLAAAPPGGVAPARPSRGDGCGGLGAENGSPCALRVSKGKTLARRFPS